ncbi:hypothetical protein WMF04_29295 [Sorangium sp. So ce260]|uniref:hypothetical protein n=1 Tax=Sorangium sp. So ce260 TaxID=3133291 RepID=UPI003F62DC13
MSTRAIVARTEGDDLLGVLNVHDSYPWELGNLLLLELLDRAGDLDGALDAWISRAPGGWSWLPDRAELQDVEQPFWRRAELTGQAWIGYVYLFDPAARALRVWNGNPAWDDRWGAPDWTLSFAADGQADPPVFSAPAPAWHEIPIVAGGDGDCREAAEQRDAFFEALREHAEDEPALARGVRDALVEQISALAWDGAEPLESGPERALRERLSLPREPRRVEDDGSLRVTFLRGEGDRYWELPLGPHRLCFPSAAASLRGQTDRLVLARADGRTAALKLESLPGDGYAVLVACAALACWPERAWSYDDGTLFAVVEVVADDGVRDPHREIAISRARELEPQCALGDELGIAHREPPVHWLVLEWLRAHAARGWAVDVRAH